MRASKGASIVIENKSIGVSRQLKANDDGAAQVSQLPSGTYTVTVTNANGTTDTRTVDVQAGQGADAYFGSLQTVVVTGSANRSLDVKSTESNQTLTKATIDRIPVIKDVTAVTLLAPGAVEGDGRIGQTGSRGGNVPSLGGASPAENAYYINGFNVTNIVNGVAFNQIPFEAIGEHQVKTGGYGAEFGRSLGGVISVNTKRGTNEFKGGISASYAPEAWRGSSVYSERNAAGVWELKNRPGGTTETKVNVWGSGALIKDELFFFGIVEGNNKTTNTYGSDLQTDLTNTSPNYLVKLDWNINKSNLLELTAFSDKSVDNINTYRSPVKYQTPRGAYVGNESYTNGGQNTILKWTSWITDDFNISALYGRGEYSRSSDVSSAACPIVRDQRVAPRLNLGCGTVLSVTDPGANDKREAFRLDGEYTLGNHQIRAGLDVEKYTVVDGTAYSGGTLYRIFNLSATGQLANGYRNTTGAAFPYVETRTFKNGGTFLTKNSAWYVEDNYQVTKDILVNAGIRNEQFTNNNADGVPFIDIKNTWAPRFGASWDVSGNGDLKVYGNLGRYFIPVYSNTNVRLAGSETNYQEFYTYGGSIGAAPQQLPLMGAQLGSRLTLSNGATPDPKTVVDPDIKPMHQDELILGFQKALASNWSVGVKYTHRKLRDAMDDVCEGDAPAAWALKNGYTAAQAAAIGDAIAHCFLYNAGRDLKANVDLNGTGQLTTLTIPASALGLPEAERLYDAVEISFERAWDKKWSFQGSYVYARSRGNTEGYVKSDIGQDDAGISQDFDHPGLMEGAHGDLPNDRQHTIKMFGSYALNNEWRIGGSLVARSGRPKNCFGYYNGTLDTTSIQYGSSSFYCNGQPTPRGSQGRLDWSKEVNLQATYTPGWQKGLTFTVDALNIFNERAVRAIEERGEVALRSPDPIYGQPVADSIQKPRQFRLTGSYEF
ncbi:TonB-dependent receptor [Rhodoferax sp. AJA081-3]|uniref:TonB-dependent receptor n=1 Tax=Rhodoferax sp. AJA081-3 TaxID=2752316 RepID=UPI001AE00A7C|nr:TonB-dependent receptor [Rhodoferax sp. AJA081-3]QTN26360.1 TonB-dependent receptor [Rhodoferax sp. AJA081-3]